MRLGWAALLVVGLGGCSIRPIVPPLSESPLAALPGWQEDRVAQAMPALLRGCARLALTPPDQSLGGIPTQRGSRSGDWTVSCAAARAVPPGDDAAARTFLQTRFDLVALPAAPLTGYFEPEVPGSREATGPYRTALLSVPADLRWRTEPTGRRVTVPYFTRAEIDAGALRRQRLDLLYVRTQIDLFFIQVEGAGRIDLPNGRVVRVGFAATNGQPAVPIGSILADLGDFSTQQVSAATIRAWLEAHPRDTRTVLERNPAYVFFSRIQRPVGQSRPAGHLGSSAEPRPIAGRRPCPYPAWRPGVDRHDQHRRRDRWPADAAAGRCAGYKSHRGPVYRLGRRRRRPGKPSTVLCTGMGVDAQGERTGYLTLRWEDRIDNYARVTGFPKSLFRRSRRARSRHLDHGQRLPRQVHLLRRLPGRLFAPRARAVSREMQHPAFVQRPGRPRGLPRRHRGHQPCSFPHLHRRRPDPY